MVPAAELTVENNNETFEWASGHVRHEFGTRTRLPFVAISQRGPLHLHSCAMNVHVVDTDEFPYTDSGHLPTMLAHEEVARGVRTRQNPLLSDTSRHLRGHLSGWRVHCRRPKAVLGHAMSMQERAREYSGWCYWLLRRRDRGTQFPPHCAEVRFLPTLVCGDEELRVCIGGPSLVDGQKCARGSVASHAWR